jgi:uncharacterized protein YbjT (DUF2867 family)
MKVLVTGATGFVGREVLRQLQRAGHAVRTLVRYPLRPANRELVSRFEIEVFPGNVLDPVPLQIVFSGVDAVIHLVGIISEVGEQTFENLHTRATRNVVAAAQQAGVKRFIHMSALGTRANAVARYHQTKWAAEEIVRASGLDWTIFRPSIIYGPGDGFVNLFARLTKFSPVVPLIGGGATRFQPVAVEQVAACFVKALAKPQSVSQAYDVCGDEVLTLAEIVEAILKVTKRKRMKLPLPFAVARVQAALLEFLFGQLLRKAPPLNRDQLLMLSEDNMGDGAPATKLFQLEHAPFVKGIARYLRRAR